MSKTKKSAGTFINAAVKADTFSKTLDAKYTTSFSLHVVCTGSTPAALAFATTDVTIAADTITEVAHGYVTGLKGQFTTTTTLPSGLSTSTDYYLIKVDADTYQVASSLANAEAGTDIDLADQGTGTHTFTATTGTSNVAKLQESNDNSNWIDVASQTVTIAASAIDAMFVADGSSMYYRVLYTPSAGQTTISAFLCSKVDA